MDRFFANRASRLVFRYGTADPAKAAEAAEHCEAFAPDTDEGELVAPTIRPSCYNCLFRRWLSDNFECLYHGTTPT